MVNFNNPAVGSVTSLCPRDVFSQTPISQTPTFELDLQVAVANGLASLQAEYEYTFRMNVSKAGHPTTPPVDRRVRVLTTEAPTVEIR